MGTVHDNGRAGEQPDLRELIDHAGAVAAAMEALIAAAEAIERDVDGLDPRALVAALSVATDVRDAGFYLTRALRHLRSLI